MFENVLRVTSPLSVQWIFKKTNAGNIQAKAHGKKKCITAKQNNMCVLGYMEFSIRTVRWKIFLFC